MKVTISFKHLKHTPSLDEKIRDKTKRLEKYLDGKTDVHWTCYTKEGAHGADIKLMGPTFQYNASASSNNLYKTLDQALLKIEKQLQRQKEKWKSKLHTKHRPELVEELQLNGPPLEIEEEIPYDKVG